MLLAGCPGKKRCEKRCEDAADTELAKSEVIQTGHICFFQLAVCFWVLGLPLCAIFEMPASTRDPYAEQFIGECERCV